MVEDPAAACRQARSLGIQSDPSSAAKLLRLAFQAQPRSVRRFERRLGSHPATSPRIGLLSKADESLNSRNPRSSQKPRNRPLPRNGSSGSLSPR